MQRTDGSDHDEQRLSLDRESQPEEPVMKISQRKRQRQIAEHSTKSKKDDGRRVTILRGPKSSEQRRNDEKEVKEHSQQQAREEHGQQQAREEHRQQQTKRRTRRFVRSRRRIMRRASSTPRIHTSSTRSTRNSPRIHRKRDQEVFVLREGE